MKVYWSNYDTKFRIYNKFAEGKAGMNCPKEIKCDYNLEQRHNSLCNLFCTKDKAVVCNYKDTEFARNNCEQFKDTDKQVDE